MRVKLALAFFLALAGSAWSAEISSEYTEFDIARDCTTYALAEEGEGDAASIVCPGWGGYPVLIDYGDARESIFYGFPSDGEEARPWESFAGFNSTAPKIEWRIVTDGRKKTPFATIHRWLVADAEISDEEIEVLVVEKVGQVGERSGCAIGYVVATENADANEKARRIADGQAFEFACGADQPVVFAGDVPLPLTTGAGDE